MRSPVATLLLGFLACVSVLISRPRLFATELPPPWLNVCMQLSHTHELFHKGPQPQCSPDQSDCPAYSSSCMAAPDSHSCELNALLLNI